MYNCLLSDVTIEGFERAQSYLEAGNEISLYAIASRLGKLTVEERSTFDFKLTPLSNEDE